MNETTRAVKAWNQEIVIPTYPAAPADPNPMFLEKRVYQGSSGRVYPNPFIDRVSDLRIDKTYQAAFLENEYVQVMILPEIGGRIHAGFDKTNQCDFIYRQHVIKPALVGLAGPWISGGVEFNWAQHHRPSTFMPVAHAIEEHADGSRTVWLSEHEPMNRMKGMVGICLHPGKSIVEAKVRLYNRTPFVQTFLWWANLAVPVHDQYQSFFPPDVKYVADHARRALSTFPIARDFYYGVDYRRGVDLTWYRNIPVPTSYMVTHSKYDFFGGYDHARRAGVVHVANRYIAPGKKQWTWGDAEFGHAWDRELTDSDGPYIELMAGVYTDNQPDFSFLQPFETRTFSQYWYPIQEIGPARNANRLMAVNLELDGRAVKIGVCATEAREGVSIVLTAGGDTLFESRADLRPGRPFLHQLTLTRPIAEPELLLRVFQGAEEIIRYQPETQSDVSLPEPASEPAEPPEIASCEELYLTGLHLEQYRHATRDPELYWTEALRRDPEDVRCNNAMGLLRMRRGQFSEAESHFVRAIRRLTRRNPNPYDGEPYYNLGLALKFQRRFEEAYAAFYKAAWNYSWQSASYYELATIDCLRHNYDASIEHLERSLATNSAHLKARNLKTALLRLAGRTTEAAELAGATRKMDLLDFWCRYELELMGTPDGDFFGLMRGDAQTCIDLALDYADAGLWSDAAGLMRRFIAAESANGAVHPMVYYALAFFLQNGGHQADALEFYQAGAAAPSTYCFPARLEEMIILEAARSANPNDARAPYYLGNLLYDRRRYEEAISCWESASRLDPAFSIPWRNLGIAFHNVRRDADRAKSCYWRAFQANPGDARLLYELDQLEKRCGASPPRRLERLEAHPQLVRLRDDLTVELATLYNQEGQNGKALEVLAPRRFHPWEGGEGLVSGQYILAHLQLGRALLEASRPADALAHFASARAYPPNLGEGKHLLVSEAHLDYFSGRALQRIGNCREAAASFELAAREVPGVTAMTYYRAMALAELGKPGEARELLAEMLAYAQARSREQVKLEYFATSLPNFLLFEDDLQKRNEVECLFLTGLAKLGLGRFQESAEVFHRVLALDVNHLGARQELAFLETMPMGQ